MQLVPFNLFILYLFRFQVAIKTNKASKPCETDAFLDEAKSMLETNAYHDNIVNLQGVTYEISTSGTQKLNVCFIELSLIFLLI